MEKYLTECLDSVLRQSLQDIEIICIDDGSTDTTPDLLDGYQNQDRRVCVIHQNNQGVAAARNKGISCATGEYVAFMDPDDFYPDLETLELLYTKASENSALICGGSFSSYNNSTGKVSTHFTGDYCKYTFTEEGYVDYRDYQFDFGYHRFLYSRVFLIENQIFFPPYSRFQDPPFFVRAMITAKSFYAVPDIVYRYRESIQDEPTSWPRTKLHDMMRGHLDNLLLSSQAQLSDLHTLTVRRLEASNVYKPVMKSLREKDPQTLNLLIKINAAINTDLLQQAGTKISDTDCYLLEEFHTLLKEFAQAKTSTISRFNRLACGAIQCGREHGYLYTLKRILYKFQEYIKEG